MNKYKQEGQKRTKSTMSQKTEAAGKKRICTMSKAQKLQPNVVEKSAE